MKKILCLLSVMAATFVTANASFIDLASLGSSALTVDGGSTTASYTHTGTGLAFTTVALGDTLGGFFNAAPLDWSSSASALGDSIYLQISFAGANPLLPISLEIYDASFSSFNFYQGTTTPISESPDYFKLDLAGSLTPSIFNNVGAIQFTWDGAGTVNGEVQSIAAVPEPSTYALIALGCLVLAGHVIRRRRRA
jgi:hypothetical protein